MSKTWQLLTPFFELPVDVTSMFQMFSPRVKAAGCSRQRLRAVLRASRQPSTSCGGQSNLQQLASLRIPPSAHLSSVQRSCKWSCSQKPTSGHVQGMQSCALTGCLCCFQWLHSRGSKKQIQTYTGFPVIRNFMELYSSFI